MIRKTTALLLILTANIVLLVHAVVPHHHHRSVTCIVNTHCDSDKNGSHDHEHDSAENKSACVLKQAVINPSFLEKLLKSYEFQNDQYHYFLLPVSLGQEALKLNLTGVLPTPGRSFLFKSHTVHPHGLRAPPVS